MIVVQVQFDVIFFYITCNACLEAILFLSICPNRRVPVQKDGKLIGRCFKTLLSGFCTGIHQVTDMVMNNFFCIIHWLFQVLLAPLFVANQVRGREKHYGRLDEIQQPEVLGFQRHLNEGQDLDVRDLNVLGQVNHHGRLDESEGLLVHGRDSHVQGGGWDFHFPPAQQILARWVFLSFHKFINA